MFRVLRLLVAVGVLLAASLTGCILSAAEYGDVQQALAVERKALGNVGMMFGGIGLAMTALTVYAIRLRRSAAQLRIDHAADLLLIDALDQLRAAIAIFDHDMKAVHWNCGFEARFPALVPLLQHGATMSEAYTFGYRSGIFSSDLDCERIDDLARETMQKVLGGKSVQHMVTTPAGQTFDLGIFQLGARHFGAIWVDVTEVHRQQDRITAQSRELERKNRQLLAFSTVAAHDLKAPLRQQSMLLDFIREDMTAVGLTLPVEVRNHFDMLGDLSRRMSHLVGDLLAFAHSDHGQAAPVCFVPHLRLEAVVALAGVDPEMAVTIMPGMPMVEVEPNAFDMVMRNLITNAVKHHDKKAGQITIRAFRAQNEVVVEVEDDGPGIPLDLCDRVFEPFARLTQVEGTGLGLSLVHKAVTSWGGTVRLRAAPERGCIFSVTMPAAAYLTHDGGQKSGMWSGGGAAGMRSNADIEPAHVRL